MEEFALPTDRPFVTTKRVLKNRPLTEEEKERKAFIESHDFFIDEDEENGTYKLIAIEKRQKND